MLFQASVFRRGLLTLSDALWIARFKMNFSFMQMGQTEMYSSGD